MSLEGIVLFDVDVSIDSDGVLHLPPYICDQIKVYKNTEFRVAGVKFDHAKDEVV